jgi:hypothetical protein
VQWAKPQAQARETANIKGIKFASRIGKRRKVMRRVAKGVMMRNFDEGKRRAKGANGDRAFDDHDGSEESSEAAYDKQAFWVCLTGERELKNLELHLTPRRAKGH